MKDTRVILITLLLVSPLMALAQAPPCPAGAVCVPNFLTVNSFTELMDKIIGFMIMIAVPVSVIAVIIASFYLMFSAGRPEYLQRAKNIYIWTGLGLGITFLAKGLVSALISLTGV